MDSNTTMNKGKATGFGTGTKRVRVVQPVYNINIDTTACLVVASLILATATVVKSVTGTTTQCHLVPTETTTYITK